MLKYRKLSLKQEISQMIHKAPVSWVGEIWQTLPMKREVFKIGQLDILSELMIFKTKTPFNFDENFPVYIKINYNNLIFKLLPGEFKVYNNQLSCSFPKFAKAIENRTLERTRFPDRLNLSVLLKAERGDLLIELKGAIEDISESGLGIKTSCPDLDFLLEHNAFKLVKICGHYVLEEADLTVKHISTRDQNGLVGIGLSANRPFGEKIFNLLREAIKKERVICRQ